jgi:riboflavin kinase/FMN adenylyltransferase
MKAPTALRGEIVRGAGLGRKLGFPTANVAAARADIPPLGIYRVEASWDGGPARPAVCSVGVRPTLGPAGPVWVEVHILDFEGDLYGKTLEVRLLERLRDEMRFSSLDELTAQIRRDVQAVRDLLPKPR